MRTRVFISGPIVKGDLAANIRQATEAGIVLLKAGYAPFTPHLSCFYGAPVPEVLPCGTVIGDWYDMDLAWIAVSHAILRLPGEGVGSDREVAYAESLGIPVFYSIQGLTLAIGPTLGRPRRLVPVA